MQIYIYMYVKGKRVLHVFEEVKDAHRPESFHHYAQNKCDFDLIVEVRRVVFSVFACQVPYQMGLFPFLSTWKSCQNICDMIDSVRPITQHHHHPSLDRLYIRSLFIFPWVSDCSFSILVLFRTCDGECTEENQVIRSSSGSELLRMLSYDEFRSIHRKYDLSRFHYELEIYDSHRLFSLFFSSLLYLILLSYQLLKYLTQNNDIQLLFYPFLPNFHTHHDHPYSHPHRFAPRPRLGQVYSTRSHPQCRHRLSRRHLYLSVDQHLLHIDRRRLFVLSDPERCVLCRSHSLLSRTLQMRSEDLQVRSNVRCPADRRSSIREETVTRSLVNTMAIAWSGAQCAISIGIFVFAFPLFRVRNKEQL